MSLAKVPIVDIIACVIAHGDGLIEAVRASEAKSRAPPAPALNSKRATLLIARGHGDDTSS